MNDALLNNENKLKIEPYEFPSKFLYRITGYRYCRFLAFVMFLTFVVLSDHT